MSTTPNTQSAYFDFLHTIVKNPGGKYITGQDEVAAMNAAALFVASKLGGLWFRLTYPVSPNVTDYTIDDKVTAITYLELIDTSVTPNIVDFVDVVPYQMFRRLQQPAGASSTFAYFWPEAHTLHIEPAPAAGRTISLLCWGMPNAMQTSNVSTLHDGNVDQMYAVVHEAASILRMGPGRDPQESAALHQRALEGIEACQDTNAQRRQVTRVGVGRQSPLTHLRRI